MRYLLCIVFATKEILEKKKEEEKGEKNYSKLKRAYVEANKTIKIN